jgi:hypothetical protein
MRRSRLWIQKKTQHLSPCACESLDFYCVITLSLINYRAAGACSRVRVCACVRVRVWACVYVGICMCVCLSVWVRMLQSLLKSDPKRWDEMQKLTHCFPLPSPPPLLPSSPSTLLPLSPPPLLSQQDTPRQ